MTIWLAIFFSMLPCQADEQPKITTSKILLIRDDPNLEMISFVAVLQVPDDLAKEVPAEQFLEQNMGFQDIASNARMITFKNHIRNPLTKKFEPNHFIGVLQKKPTKHAEIMATKGKFIVTKTSELIGFRIGLHTGLSQGFIFRGSDSKTSAQQKEGAKSAQSGWAVEIETEGQGTHTEMIPTTHSLIWLTATPSGFVVSLPDDQDLMKVGKKVFTGNDLVIYRYAIFATSVNPQDGKNNPDKKA